MDWWAVGVEARSVECVAKPLTLALLVGAALVLKPVEADVRTWFVAGLLASLVGDVVLLMSDRWFVGGLAAFLVAHGLYVVGFAIHGPRSPWWLIGLAIAGIAMVLLMPTLLAGVRRYEAKLVAPVTGYVMAISTMVVVAVGAGHLLAAAGALAFFVSDACLGWARFVRPFPGHRVAVHSSYHVGQALLVAWLAR